MELHFYLVKLFGWSFLPKVRVNEINERVKLRSNFSYVNPLNTTLEFDVTFANWQTTEGSIRMQNNIQSAFNRVRLLYGATPLEDVINYNQIARCLTEWTATNDQGAIDQTSISEGSRMELIGRYWWVCFGC